MVKRESMTFKIRFKPTKIIAGKNVLKPNEIQKKTWRQGKKEKMAELQKLPNGQHYVKVLKCQVCEVNIQNLSIGTNAHR